MTTSKRRKKPKYYHKICEPCYQTKIYFVIDPDRKEFAKRIKKDFGVILNDNYKTEGDACYFDIESNGDRIHFIWMRAFSWMMQETALLHHEMLHLTFDVLRIIGISLVEESEEAFTYFYQKLMIEIYGVLRDMHPEEKKKKKRKP